jgi:hypothetical protein
MKFFNVYCCLHPESSGKADCPMARVAGEIVMYGPANNPTAFKAEDLPAVIAAAYKQCNRVAWFQVTVDDFATYGDDDYDGSLDGIYDEQAEADRHEAEVADEANNFVAAWE